MAVLDHVVINALRDVDAAEALFAALGFALTPRGHHDLGSINHLMVTPGAYLEISGVPLQGRQRQEVLDSPRGLNGIVLKTGDAEATFARLTEAGFDALPPMDFSRPLVLDGAEHQVSFRNVRMMPDFFGGGRVYFCQHVTPDLVWRPEWMAHPNGFRAIDLVEVESPDPRATADRFARAFEGRLSAGGPPCRVALDDSDIVVHAGPAERMRATGLVFDDLEDIVARATDAGVGVERSAPDRATLTLRLADMDATLLCRGSA